MNSKIEKRGTFASGKWLCLEKIEYVDAFGKRHTWESVMRIKGTGAVAVIATMRQSDRIILIRQFRPPANGYVIEFPAGLIDEGETFEECAVRELREETGYHCSVVKVLPPMFSSPGLSCETIAFVLADVDEDNPKNHTLITDFDESEDIETFTVKVEELSNFINERESAGDLLDSKVVSYVLGISSSLGG